MNATRYEWRKFSRLSPFRETDREAREQNTTPTAPAVSLACRPRHPGECCRRPQRAAPAELEPPPLPEPLPEPPPLPPLEPLLLPEPPELEPVLFSLAFLPVSLIFAMALSSGHFREPRSVSVRLASCVERLFWSARM